MERITSFFYDCRIYVWRHVVASPSYPGPGPESDWPFSACDPRRHHRRPSGFSAGSTHGPRVVAGLGGGPKTRRPPGGSWKDLSRFVGKASPADVGQALQLNRIKHHVESRLDRCHPRQPVLRRGLWLRPGRAAFEADVTGYSDHFGAGGSQASSRASRSPASALTINFSR